MLHELPAVFSAASSILLTTHSPTSVPYLMSHPKTSTWFRGGHSSFLPLGKPQVTGCVAQHGTRLPRSFSWWKRQPLVLSTRDELCPDARADAWVPPAPRNTARYVWWKDPPPCQASAAADVDACARVFTSCFQANHSRPSQLHLAHTTLRCTSASICPPTPPWGRHSGSGQAMGSGQADPEKWLSFCRPELGYSK